MELNRKNVLIAPLLMSLALGIFAASAWAYEGPWDIMETEGRVVMKLEDGVIRGQAELKVLFGWVWLTVEEASIGYEWSITDSYDLAHTGGWVVQAEPTEPGEAPGPITVVCRRFEVGRVVRVSGSGIHYVGRIVAIY